ncbi:MAG: dihydropteroate synthase [Ferruginibacter sp.]
MFTLNCKGKIVSIEKPLLMGIINITADSFYKGYLDKDIDVILQLAAEMIKEGADILDIGGQSTKPGSKQLSVEEETQRVLPVIEAIHRKFPDTIISIDTFHSKVASAAVHAGASIVNDVSAGNMDEDMIATVASLRVPYICMHMKGTPETMQLQPHYENLTREILDFFIAKIAECKTAGIKDIIIDPGFGFGKTITHNFELLKNLSIFKMLELPILAGLSRKSTIYKTLKIDVSEALNGTTVLNTIALLNGANILRVHDVKEAKETILLINRYKNAAE